MLHSAAVTELETHIADHRKAIDEFIAAARAVEASRWNTPRAEGAWSPGQVAEHLALIYQYNRQVATGTAPSPIPWLLRPVVQRLARGIVVDGTLKAGRFTRKGRAPRVFQPPATAASSADVLARIDAGVRGFEADIRSRHPEARRTVAHPIFGEIATSDWVRLQAIHVRHHLSQLT